VNGLLNAADNEPSVKRFVFTSSGIAATTFKPNEKFHVNSSSWNTEDVEAAWKPAPYEAARAFPVYGASKTQAEKACYAFVESKQPSFVLNTVLPWSVFGEVLDARQSAMSVAFIPAAWSGQTIELFASMPPRWFVDVKDVARLHLAALIEADVQNERLFGCAEPFNYNDLMRLLRKLGPDREIAEDIEDQSRDLSTVDAERSVELLHRLGRPGFTSLEDSVKQLLGLEC